MFSFVRPVITLVLVLLDLRCIFFILLLLIPTYVCVESTKLMYWFLHTYSSEKRFSFFISDGCEDICFSHFSCEKQISSHPSEAVPGFSDGATTSINIFFLCVFYPKYYYYITYTLSLNRQTRELDPSFLPFYQWPWHMAHPPPLSKIRLKQDEYWGGRGKNSIGG